MPETSIQQIVKVDSDSIAIGSASKGALIKIYLDFNNKEAAKKKIDNAAEIKKYALANLAVNT